MKISLNVDITTTWHAQCECGRTYTATSRACHDKQCFDILAEAGWGGERCPDCIRAMVEATRLPYPDGCTRFRRGVKGQVEFDAWYGWKDVGLLIPAGARDAANAAIAHFAAKLLRDNAYNFVSLRRDVEPWLQWRNAK